MPSILPNRNRELVESPGEILTRWDKDFAMASRLRALASATAIMAAASPLALLICSCRSASVEEGNMNVTTGYIL